MTALNTTILDMVRASEGHLTAEQAFFMAKQQGVHVSISSIYRILSKLSEKGHIRRIPFGDRPDVFDKTLESHGHMICEKCGKISDIGVFDLIEKLEEQTGADISSCDLCVRYICDDCQK